MIVTLQILKLFGIQNIWKIYAISCSKIPSLPLIRVEYFFRVREDDESILNFVVEAKMWKLN